MLTKYTITGLHDALVLLRLNSVDTGKDSLKQLRNPSREDSENLLCATCNIHNAKAGYS